MLSIIAFVVVAVVVPVSAAGDVKVDGKAPAPFVAIKEGAAVVVPAGATLVLLIDGRQHSITGPAEGTLAALLAQVQAKAPEPKAQPAASSASKAAQALSSWLFAGSAKDNAVGAVRGVSVARFVWPPSSSFRKGSLPFTATLPSDRPPLSQGPTVVAGATLQVGALPLSLRAHDRDVVVWTALADEDDKGLRARLADAAQSCGADAGWCALVRAQLLAEAGCTFEAEALLSSVTNRALVDPPLPWRPFELSVDATWSTVEAGPFVALNEQQRGGVLRLKLRATRAAHVELIARLADGSYEVVGVLSADEVRKQQDVNGDLPLPATASSSSTLVIATLEPGTRKEGDRFQDPKLGNEVRALHTKRGVIGGGWGRVVVVGLR